MTDEQVNELFEELKWAKIEAEQAHMMVEALRDKLQTYAAENEQLLLAKRALLRQIRWNNDCVDADGATVCPNPGDCACAAEMRAMIELEGK